jgi:hypothetical protein
LPSKFNVPATLVSKACEALQKAIDDEQAGNIGRLRAAKDVAELQRFDLAVSQEAWKRSQVEQGKPTEIRGDLHAVRLEADSIEDQVDAILAQLDGGAEVVDVDFAVEGEVGSGEQPDRTADHQRD